MPKYTSRMTPEAYEALASNTLSRVALSAEEGIHVIDVEEAEDGDLVFPLTISEALEIGTALVRGATTPPHYVLVDLDEFDVIVAALDDAAKARLAVNGEADPYVTAYFGLKDNLHARAGR